MNKPKLIQDLEKITSDNQRRRVKFKNGTMTIDTFSASAILCVYNTFTKDSTKQSLLNRAQTKEGFIWVANTCFGLLSKK